ncbi:uncharacterized protein LOC124113688 isoform X2 [Haliotis rufescens]|uniref:uncharacterized protein LOC124113688 isoform X2 n=1 Tax=Haliotis rufescens TaxID=6454 RepID=UPI001EAFD427|nr:uncharacterized protein LOC124113688 isoform X2 [Haliotis rufescens]XP_046330154.1 uncharacterized protein LOC124113688 isoform X2 [Haliotis rufescens]XP_046330165.1 uncharacterized protein LOC124113688 isoform X2 [Haliotis rufescens]
MNALCVWVTVGLACVLFCQTLGAEVTDCLPIKDPRCVNSSSTANINGVRFCCPGSGSMSTSTTNNNGVQTQSCKCGGPVKMPEMPDFHWPRMHNPLPFDNNWGWKFR